MSAAARRGPNVPEGLARGEPLYSDFTPDCIASILILALRAREVAKRLEKAGATWNSGKGSHRKYQYKTCRTVVAMHPGDMNPNTLRAIEKQMAPCLGKGWLLG